MNVLANGYYMRFDDFVNSFLAFNLKILALYYQVFIRQPWKLILLSMRVDDIIPHEALTNHILALRKSLERFMINFIIFMTIFT